jgi:tetratricopeptide (TPR) repeat protein
MPRRARPRPYILAAAVAFASGLARAEDPVVPYPACHKTPTEGDVAAAKGAFQAGNASFNEADYDRAINYWEDAYRRDCTAHPNLLNLARAYELNGQKLHAVNALETFLARSPGRADDDQIKRRIEKLREQIADEKTAAAPVTDPAPAPPPETQPAPEPPREPPPDVPVRTERRSFVPLLVAGAGGVAAITGTIVYFSARSDYDGADGKCPDHTNCATNITEAGNAAKSRMKVGGWVVGAGGVVIAGGLVWYFLQKPEVTTAKAPRGFVSHVTPAFGPGYGGVEFAGRF